MPLSKGQTNNRAGRPPKNRALTAMLEAGGSKTVVLDGKRISSKQMVARCLWELLTTGATALPDGDTLLLTSTQEWIDLAKWLYAQVDGPPKLSVEQETTGDVTIRVVYGAGGGHDDGLAV